MKSAAQSKTSSGSGWKKKKKGNKGGTERKESRKPAMIRCIVREFFYPFPQGRFWLWMVGEREREREREKWA